MTMIVERRRATLGIMHYGSVVALLLAVLLFLLDHVTASSVVLLLAGCLLVPSGLLSRSYYARNRRECLETLLKRPACDLEEQYALVMRKGHIPRQDVERIWLGVANFHKVPADRLRASDVPRVDLKGILGHPDYDMFFCPLIVLHKGPAKEALERVVDWGDLILCLYQFEQEQGKLGTKRIMRDGSVDYVWDA